MGLDAYAYAAHERGERRRYWDNAKINKKTGDYESPYKLPHELAYWRKHRDLQAWMSDLWNSKGQPYPNTDADPIWGSTFNGVELELEWDDIQKLEEDIKTSKGRLFRDDDSYREEDLLQFCLDAKEQIFLFRKRIFYYSSW